MLHRRVDVISITFTGCYTLIFTRLYFDFERNYLRVTKTQYSKCVREETRRRN